MANHGYVKSRKKMDPKRITEVLQDLNTTRFKGLLTIEHTDDMWEVSAPKYVYRRCWLETPHRFEIKHGPGGTFAWWVDFHISNAIALAYDGTIYDDGCDIKEKGDPNYCPTLSEMYDRMQIPHAMLEHESRLTPPEFRDQLPQAL